MAPTLDKLKNSLRKFADEREWGQFHTPKNLSMALIVESAELVELFQWLSNEDCMNLDDEHVGRIKEEVGDILIYLVRFCDVLNIDLIGAALNKLEKNKSKYPVHLAKGSARKF